MARFQRCDEPQHIIPMLTYDVRANLFSEKRCQIRIAASRLNGNKTPIREIAQARAKPETKSGTEREDVIGCSASVGVMLRDIEIRAVMQQPVENIRRFVGSCRDDLYVVRAMLVGHMGIEAEPRINAVSGIHITTGLCPFSASEELAV